MLSEKITRCKMTITRMRRWAIDDERVRAREIERGRWRKRKTEGRTIRNKHVVVEAGVTGRYRDGSQRCG